MDRGDEAETCPVKPALHRRHREPESFRALFPRNSLDITEDEDLAVLAVERGKCPVKGVPAFGRHGDPLRIIRPEAGPDSELDQRRSPILPTSRQLFPRAKGSIPSDDEEPSPD